MNKKYKIINILNSTVMAAKLSKKEIEMCVDALIANGVDFDDYKIEAEYWEKSYNEEHIKYVNFVKSEARDMKSMMKSRNEWKYKAKLTEAALEEACEDKAKYLSPCTTLGILFDAAIYKQEYLQKAKTKIN